MNVQTENWLEDAIDLEPYFTSAMPRTKKITNIIYDDLASHYSKLRGSYRYKEAIKMILINIYVAWRLGMPIRYSRSPSQYSHHKRYGQLHFKYDRIMPVMKYLLREGYIKQKKGKFISDKDFGRRTRAWATPKLIEVFQRYEFRAKNAITRSTPTETIELKNKDKIRVNYSPTRKRRAMKNNLDRINNFLSKQKIVCDAPGESEVNLRFLNKLNKNNIINVVDINIDKLNFNIYNSNTISTINSIYTMTRKIREISNNYRYYKSRYYHNKPLWYEYENIGDSDSFSHIVEWINRSMMKYARNSKGYTKMYNAKVELHNFSIDNLYFTINHQPLRRVFNKRTFNKGGRFYGAFHLELLSDLRKHLYINDEPTVELDFEALHVRMLYHLIGEKYKDDPYGVLCKSKQERKAYKYAILVAINAPTFGDALRGARDMLRRKNVSYPLTNVALRELINTFCSEHNLIKKYICSGKGLELQNRDSHITEGILLRLMEMDIPCLPVHDSYIVPARYEDVLWQVMRKEYKKVMKFEPVIEKKE